jgi:predicted esterase YcpF (UPF0227 family)
MEKIKTMEEAMQNPELSEVVEIDNELKTFIVEYVGKELQPESEEITVEMVIEVLASHFPEVVFALAEENFIRGYQQATDDLGEPAERCIDAADTPYDEKTNFDVEGYHQWKGPDRD